MCTVYDHKTEGVNKLVLFVTYMQWKSNKFNFPRDFIQQKLCFLGFIALKYITTDHALN